MGRTLRILLCLLVAAAPVALTPAAARGDEWDGVAFQQKSPDGIFAWLVLPTRMVLNDADLPPNLVEPPPVYRLSAARNEWECAQLVIMLAAPVRNVSVEFSDFTTGAGEGDTAAAKITPASWSANFVKQVPGRVPQRAASMIKSWPVRKPDDKPDQVTPGTYSPSASNIIPDALLRDFKFDLDRGLNRIWLTVGVPREARPGDYAGVARVKRDGQTLFEVPLALRVWNHMLPDEPTVTVMADVSPDLPPDFALAEKKPLWDRLRPYYENLKYHYIAATGEIYPLEPWRRDRPPPDMTDYGRALKYVLDDLGFARFRFPGIAGAAGGTWQDIAVFQQEAPQQIADGLWISGAAFSKAFPEDWTRVAGQGAAHDEEFGGATLAGYSAEKAPAWVEYEFETSAPAGEPVNVWLQVAPVQASERKLVSIDGQPLGALTNEQFLKHPLGFARIEKPVTLAAGKHTLRVAVDDVVGAADPIYGVFVTPNRSPDLDLLLRERAKLSADFKDAFEYHAREVGDFLRQNKWLKKAHARMKDEAGVGEYGRIASVYDFVGELLPTLRREIADLPSPMLRKSAEVWTPHLSGANFEPEEWLMSLKPGDELWVQHNFLHTLGYPSIAMRILPWTLGRHGIKGYQFWSVNYWASDPWKDTNQNGSHMRGTLLYPDPKTGQPVNSVRWELFRDGLEDYETLRMLRTAMDETYGLPDLDHERRVALEAGERLLSDEISAFVRNARDFSWDPAELQRLRDRAGELLSTLTPPDEKP